MNVFEEIALRLKQQLGLTEDQEVAAMLGLSKHAWMGRKKRGNFPTLELHALAAKRPELKLDVDYVLNGDLLRPFQAANLALAFEYSRDNPHLMELAIKAGKDMAAINTQRKDTYLSICEMLDCLPDDAIPRVIQYIADVRSAELFHRRNKKTKK